MRQVLRTPPICCDFTVLMRRSLHGCYDGLLSQLPQRLLRLRAPRGCPIGYCDCVPYVLGLGFHVVLRNGWRSISKYVWALGFQVLFY